MKRWFATLAAVGLLAGAAVRAGQDVAAPQEPDDEGRGTIGVLRRDGMIVPFAALERNGWNSRWPVALQAIDIPITLEAIPQNWWGGGRLPSSWRAWFPSGGAQPLKVVGPSLQRVYCQTRMALRTDYQSKEALPPGPIDPFPKDGLVTTGTLEVEPIEVVTGAEERAALAVALLAELNKVEATTIRRVRSASNWRHPIAEKERPSVPIRIESWYRAPGPEPGTMVSYVEAVKSYPARPEDEGCGLETLFSGWVFSSKTQLVTRSDLYGRVTYCDRVGALYMLPFGRMHAHGRPYWIFQMSGWEEEWYTIAQIERRSVRVVLEFPAGGRFSCRR